MDNNDNTINIREEKERWEKEDDALMQEVIWESMVKLEKLRKKKPEDITDEEIWDLFRTGEDRLRRNLHEINPVLIEQGYVSADPKKRKLGIL